MKLRQIVIDGMIDKSGNIKITEKPRMQAFAKKWTGRNVVITIDALPEEASKVQIARYYKRTVPDFQAGYKEVTGESLTLCKADEELRRMSPVCIEEIKTDDGIEFGRLKTINELSGHELTEFINHVEMLVAQEFGIVL